MSVRGVKLINGKEPLLRHVVFELRYDYGFNYLDRCGKILNRISRDHGEWVIASQVSPQNANLYSMKNDCRFGFNALNCSLDIDRTNSASMIADEDINDFAIQCEEMTSVVIDELALTEFSRIGFRAWYYFPCNSKKESDMWIQELGIISLAPDLISTYGSELESISLAAVITGPDHRLRIGFESLETSAQLHPGPETINIKASKLRGGQRAFLREQLKARRRLEINAKHAATIDFDSFQEDPLSIDPRDFITHNFSLLMDRLYRAIPSVKRKADKKG
jgi:hypothetical protein